MSVVSRRERVGAAQARGIRRIWLTPEFWNEAAIALNGSVGFTMVEDPRFEQSMTFRLAAATDERTDEHTDEHTDGDHG